MKSRLAASALCLAMTLMLGACAPGVGGSPTTTPSSEPSESSFSYSDGIDDNGFWKGIVALEYVELPDYRKVTIPSKIHKISASAVQAGIDELLLDFATTKEIKNRAVKDGDSVNIDYVGSVDGVEFEGGSTGGSGTVVTIGETQYIDDFLEQIIGHKPGETFNINVTFPTPYQNAELSGKDAVFVTTINFIAEAVPAKLNDAFVAENLSTDYGWKTVKEAKAGIAEDLQRQAIQKYLQDYLVNDVVYKSVPDALVEYQNNTMIKYFETNAATNNTSLAEYLATTAGVSSVDELIAKNADNNLKSAKFNLVIQAIAEDAQITVSVDDVSRYILEQLGAADYSQYETTYGMPYLKQVALVQKVMEFLDEHDVLE